jgi:hypothetical protein
MRKLKNSTKERPLLFFEDFLEESNFKEFQDNFYSNVINPSFKAYRNLGYIEYLNDVYVDPKDEKVRIYFIDRLEITLKNQVSISKELIDHWIEEYLNRNESANNYISNQKSKLVFLKNSLNFKKSTNELIIQYLNQIDTYLLNFGPFDIKETFIQVESPIIYPRTLFGLKSHIKRSHIEELYEVSCDSKIINNEVVSFNTFYNVLTCTPSEKPNEKIKFLADNQIVAYFFKCLESYFRDLKPTVIVKSELFLNRKENEFTAGALDTALTQSKGKPTAILEEIKTEIDDIFLDS